MTERTPQTQDKFIVRLPDGMRDRIKAAAERNGRSMNAEIVAALDAHFPLPQRPQDVVSEVALSLSFVEPDLREQAIALLKEYAATGRLSLLARAEEAAQRDWSGRPPWED
jgi:plasmid stability protein